MSALLQRVSTVWFKDLDKWQPYRARLAPVSLPRGWRITRIRDFAYKVTERVRVEPGKQYKMLGVKWYAAGVFLRETVSGDSMSAAWVTPAKPGAFVYNRLFAWKESFAVMPTDFEGCFVSGEFPQFILDSSQISSDYLYLLFRLKSVIRAVNAASEGSAAVSRNRFKEEEFLRMELPIPPIETQQIIISQWKKAQRDIVAVEKLVRAIKTDWERWFLQKIGITVDDPKSRRGSFLLQSEEMERWDSFFYRPDFISLEKQFRKTHNARLGDLLRFISRPWSPRDFPQGHFRYVEIANVNHESGINSYREVAVDQAPSRATTLIKTGDILISTTRPYLGAFTRVGPDYDGYVCSSGFAVADSVKVPDIDPEYILMFLKSPAGLRQMERRMTGGLYPAIVQDELERIVVPLPQKRVQQEMLGAYEEVSKRVVDEREVAHTIARNLEAKLEAYMLGTEKVRVS